jgi:hypothetical protein
MTNQNDSSLVLRKSSKSLLIPPDIYDNLVQTLILKLDIGMIYEIILSSHLSEGYGTIRLDGFEDFKTWFYLEEVLVKSLEIQSLDLAFKSEKNGDTFDTKSPAIYLCEEDFSKLPAKIKKLFSKFITTDGIAYYAISANTLREFKSGNEDLSTTKNKQLGLSNISENSKLVDVIKLIINSVSIPLLIQIKLLNLYREKNIYSIDITLTLVVAQLCILGLTLVLGFSVIPILKNTSLIISQLIFMIFMLILGLTSSPQIKDVNEINNSYSSLLVDFYFDFIKNNKNILNLVADLIVNAETEKVTSNERFTLTEVAILQKIGELVIHKEDSSESDLNYSLLPVDHPDLLHRKNDIIEYF